MVAVNAYILEGEPQRCVFIIQAVLVFTQIFLALGLLSFSWAFSEDCFPKS